MGQCTSPIKGYRGLDGKFTSSPRKAYKDQHLTIRCGWCIQCRLERARIWAIRCTHEASLYAENCFCTFSYDEENIPYGNTLHRPHFQNFIKRLRLRTPGLRLYYCGEYGGETDRPHYHALLFNFRPSDGELVKDDNGKKTYTSEKLTKTWSHGQASFSDVTFTSAAYVASYTTAKILGPTAKDHYQYIHEDTGEITDRVPPFSGMSMRPGIGQPWIEKWLFDTYKNDSIVIEGREMRPPRYYDQYCEKHDLPLWRKVRKNRVAEYHRTLKQEKDGHGQIIKHGYMDANKIDSTYKGSDRQLLCKAKITLKNQRPRKEQ